MAKTVSDFLVERLKQWNVERIYAYPGDGTAGIEAALRKAGDDPRFVQARHEELCAFMACAHAKFTGQVGVCLATSGPGAIHLLNGLYDAKMDHQPVVAIVGQAATTAMGSHYQQEVDLQNLFKDVASEYVTTINSPAAVQHAIDRAFRIAMDSRSVTCLIIPKDIQEMAFEEARQLHNYSISSIAQGHVKAHIVPQRADLHAAAAILNAGKKVAMLVGHGCLDATDDVIAVADKLGGGIAKSWLGKAVVPDDVPFCTNSIGLLGTKASWDMMQSCDTLLIVGCNFPYAEFYPKLGQAKAVQIDVDGRMLALRYPIDVALKGDAKDTLQALLPILDRKEDRSWQEQIAKWSAASWEQTKKTAAIAASKPGMINPERVFTELSPKLPDRCILAADSGTSANWYGRDLKIRRGMMASGSGNLATMGAAVPYAVAAKFCYPDRVAIALTGDGAMQMNGLNACITVGKYWKEWSNPRWICMVLNNRDLNQVTWEQRVMTGDVRFVASQELPDFPYAQFAESIGLRGIRVDDPEEIAGAWDRALSSDRPVVLECITDPDTPTLPPHITIDEAYKFSRSLFRGDPNEGGVIKQAVKSLVATLVPSAD